MSQEYRLTEAGINKELVFVRVDSGSGATQKLTDMGLIPGVRLKVLHNVGRGPVKISLKDSKLALGHGIAHRVIVREHTG